MSAGQRPVPSGRLGERPVAPKKNYVPDEVEFRTKPQIALELIDRALGNGVRVAAWTFDELYGRDGKFLDGLEQRQQTFVGEIPMDFHGWVQKPRDSAFWAEKAAKTGPRQGVSAVGASPSFLRSSQFGDVLSVFREQSWQRYRIKDTDKGPEVWEVKWAVFWRKGEDGLPGRRHCLIVARNVLTEEVKYFLANRVPGEKGISLRWLLRVAFGRWSVERCFRVAKDELGMDHYQVRGWRCLHRHFYLTQASYLFCARIRQQYDTAGQRAAGSLDDRASPQRDEHLAIGRRPEARRPPQTTRERTKTSNATTSGATGKPGKSHTKTKIARFTAMGINVNQIKSCII